MNALMEDLIGLVSNLGHLAISNVCHPFSGVAHGSKLIPALYEKAQAPE